MSETKTLDVCPKCGAYVNERTRTYTAYECGSGADNDTGKLKQMAKCRIRELEQETARLRQRLLTAAGDDLCRLSQEEIKAMSLGTVKIPPKEEFLPSCERFHAQMVGEVGVMTNCLTTAQLIAEVAGLESALAAERERCKAYQDKARGDFWMWQGDGDDHLESLVCPVLIRPQQLAAILAERERVAKAVEACCAAVEADADICTSMSTLDAYGQAVRSVEIIRRHFAALMEAEELRK